MIFKKIIHHIKSKTQSLQGIGEEISLILPVFTLISLLIILIVLNER